MLSPHLRVVKVWPGDDAVILADAKAFQLEVLLLLRVRPPNPQFLVRVQQYLVCVAQHGVVGKVSEERQGGLLARAAGAACCADSEHLLATLH